MVKKSLGCKWSEVWMWSEIWKLNHLKSEHMAAILSKIIWNMDKNIQILNGLVYISLCVSLLHLRNRWNVCMNGTTSAPKSVLRYVMDKVKLFVPIWGILLQCQCPELKFPIKVFHMSETMFYFFDVVVVKTKRCKVLLSFFHILTAILQKWKLKM